MLVSDPIAGVKQVPFVGFLDQRQMLQRPRRIFPGEEKIRKGAVMHRANRGSWFRPCRQISTFAVSSENGLTPRQARSTCRRRGSHVAGADARNPQAIDREFDPSPTLNEAPVIAAAAATTNALACSVGFRDFAGPGLVRRAGSASGPRSRARPPAAGAGATALRQRLRRLSDCAARRLLCQQAEQFDGIEPRRGRQWSGAENTKQLRSAAALVLRQDMKDDKGEDHPVPTQCSIATS